MPRTFIISDTHFFHENIIKYCNRPFQNVRDMNATMFNNWNKTVQKNDIVIHLGDISANLLNNHNSLKWILNNLNGKKILVKGNHDHCSDNFYYKCSFQKIFEYLEINDYFLCHYPCFENSKYKQEIEQKYIDIFKKSKCSKIIHGHNHNNYSNEVSPSWDDGIFRINTSVEVQNYTPMEFNFKN